MKLSFDQWLATVYQPIAGAETPPATEAATPAEGESGEQPPPQPDFSPVMDRMDEVMNAVGAIEQRLPEPQQPQPPEDEFGLYGDPSQQTGEWDPSQGPDASDPQAVLQFIRAEAQAAAEARLTPELERQATERREAETEQFLEDYPALQDNAVAQGLVNDAQQWATDITRDVARGNPQLAQALVQEPAFLELVHLAAQTAERAEQETPAGSPQGEVTLDGASAGNPGGAAPQANLGEQIKGAGSGHPFWTGAGR